MPQCLALAADGTQIRFRFGDIFGIAAVVRHATHGMDLSQVIPSS